MRSSEWFSAFMAVLVMGLAIYAVPFPASLMFVVAIALGAVIAYRRIRKSGDSSGTR